MKNNILFSLTIAGIIMLVLWIFHGQHADDSKNDTVTWFETPVYATLPQGRSQCMGFEYETTADDPTTFTIRPQWLRLPFLNTPKPQDGALWVLYVHDQDGYHRRVWGRLEKIGSDQAGTTEIFKFEVAEKYVDGYADYYGVKQSNKKIKTITHSYYPRENLSLQNSPAVIRLYHDMFEGFGTKDPGFEWWLKCVRTAYPILAALILLAIAGTMIKEKIAKR